jgi:hypothetical protein
VGENFQLAKTSGITAIINGSSRRGMSPLISPSIANRWRG